MPTAPVVKERVFMFRASGHCLMNKHYANAASPDYACGDPDFPVRMYIKNGTYGSYVVSGLTEAIVENDTLVVMYL
jgi:hypothetical protein